MTTMQAPEEQEWRQIRLSLERPYKDDNGQPISTLLDITPDGQFIYEPREEWDAKLGERFRRIFAERGIDFFDTDPDSRYLDEAGTDEKNASSANEKDASTAEQEKEDADADGEVKLMTPEMLFNMRNEIIPRLQYVRVISMRPNGG